MHSDPLLTVFGKSALTGRDTAVSHTRISARGLAAKSLLQAVTMANRA